MRRIAWVLLVLCLVLNCGCALASGSYTGGDDLGNAGIGSAVVITKSATIRSKPSYQGKKVVSVEGESELLVLGRFEGNWAEVQCTKKGKTYTGWINQSYIVSNYLTLTLRKSNVPAYCAPTREAKMVGSLPKYTQLNVIGMWDDFYIVSLRNASAFIHKDAGLWTSVEIYEMLSSSVSGRTTCETTLRTGPGEDWPEAETCKANAALVVSKEFEDGEWYFVTVDGKPAYAKKADVAI